MSAISTIKNAPPNRVVSLLTPTVFAPLAGAIAAAAANYAPGVDISADALQAIFIAGATIAFGSSGIWMKGWQDQQKRDAEASAGGLADQVGDDADLDLDTDEHDADLEPDLDSDLEPDLDSDFEPELDIDLDSDADADADAGIDFDPDLDEEDHELMALTGASEE